MACFRIRIQDLVTDFEKGEMSKVDFSDKVLEAVRVEILELVRYMPDKKDFEYSNSYEKYVDNMVKRHLK